jgi:hypothetical protein
VHFRHKLGLRSKQLWIADDSHSERFDRFGFPSWQPVRPIQPGHVFLATGGVNDAFGRVGLTLPAEVAVITVIV